MLPNFTIGLNETQFGLVAPKFVRDSFINALHSRRIAEMALIQGKMFTSQEALKGGLVDELAATKEVGLEKCSKFLSTFAKVDPAARSLTKLKFRGSDLEDLRREKDKDLEGFVAMITDKYTQQKLEKYLQQIQKKKNK